MNTRMKKMPFAMAQVFGAGVVAGLAATATQAQQPQKVEKIEVTGSNIKRVDTEGPAPVQVIKREDIEKSGATSVSEVLRNITSQSGGSFEERTFGTFAAGSSGVSLRGLGQSATLVLINGRRVAGFGFAQNFQDAFVDLNTLPLGAVERIEVLKDGASAIYGSDAIAGVINVILRKDFKGIDATFFAGAAKSGSATSSGFDANELKTSITAGFGDLAKDRFNVMLTVDYFKRDPLILRDRKFSASADLRSRGGVDNRSPSSVPGTVFNYTTGLYQALPGCAPGDIEISAGGSICKFNFNQFASLIPSAERKGIFASGTFEFSPKLSAFAEVSFNKSSGRSEFAPVPSGTYFAAGAPGNPVPADPVFALRRLLEFGPRLNDTYTDFSRIVVGLKGTLGNWDWQSAGGYSRSEVSEQGFNRVRADRLSAAIANGTFLFGSLNGAAIVDPIRIPRTERLGKSTLKFIDAKGSTELMQMAGGAVGLAVGAERRSQSISDTPDPLVLAGLSSRENGFAVPSVSRNEWSAYGEVSIPFAQGWESQIAVRHDNYQTVGSTTNPKFALSWKPIKSLLLRGSYGEGFRAPGLHELYTGITISQVTIIDGPRCAAGVAAACGATQTNARLGGNPNLKPEESKSFNLGFVWDATNDLTLGVDVYKIEHTNKIQSNAQFVVNNEANPPAGAAVIRAASPAPGVPGRITRIDAPFLNVSRQEVSGADMDLTYRINLGNNGKVVLISSTAYIDSLKQAAAPDSPLGEVAGTGSQGYSYPRTRNRSTVEWTRGNWAALLAANYDHSYSEDDLARAATNAGARRTVSSFTTWDTQATYSGFKNLKLILGIKNLVDEDPPFKSNATEGYDVERDNPRGRFFYFQANYTFK